MIVKINIYYIYNIYIIYNSSSSTPPSHPLTEKTVFCILYPHAANMPTFMPKHNDFRPETCRVSYIKH